MWTAFLFFSFLSFPLSFSVYVSLHFLTLSSYSVSLSLYIHFSLSLPPSLILFLPLSPPLLKSCFFMDLGGQVGGGAT